MSHGVDGITNEQLKYGEGALLIHLEHMFKKVWKDEIPDDWLNGVIIIIRISNLLQVILLRRLDAGMECLLRENQCGFRLIIIGPDQMYSLCTIIYNCIEYNISCVSTLYKLRQPLI